MEMRKKWFKIGLIAVIVLCAAAAGATYWSIQSGLSDAIDMAQAAHPNPGNDVAALVAYVDSDQHDLERRNRAVWALGRIGDPMALLVFEKYYNGAPCDHETRLCQYELAKAINQCLDNLPGQHKKVPADASYYEKD
jgi:hypothetical protein